MSGDQKEGASLERLSLQANAGQPTNWATAAYETGDKLPGTPTRENRQRVGIYTERQDVTIWCEKPRFSPDHDGFEDQLIIYYQMPRPGFVAHAVICNSAGSVVKKLQEEFLTGATGFWYWDGATDQMDLAPPGIYVINAEFVHPEGEVVKKKLAVVNLKKME